MRIIVDFVKTTLLGGVVILIPLLLLYLLFSEMLEIMVALATPIIDLLPANVGEKIGDPLSVAIFVLLISALLAGLALRSLRLKRIGRWIEGAALNKLPMYKAAKSLSHGLLGVESKEGFSCGIVELSPGVLELVYIVEDAGNGYITVLVPLAPTGFNGPLKIIESEQVIRINATVGEASARISEWGVGLQQLLPDDTPLKSEH